MKWRGPPEDIDWMEERQSAYFMACERLARGLANSEYPPLKKAARLYGKRYSSAWPETPQGEPHIQFLEDVKEHLLTPAGKKRSQESVNRDLLVFLMCANGDYNCADARPEFTAPLDGPGLSKKDAMSWWGLQPPKWAELRAEVWAGVDKH